MTGKTLRATLLAASLMLMSTGMALLNQPSTTGHENHVLGAMLIGVGVITAFVREQIKEEQAKDAVDTIERLSVIL